MKSNSLKLITLGLLVMACGTLFAQRTPNKRGEINYTRLPLTPLQENIKTYQIDAILTSLSAEDNRDQLTRTLTNAFRLHGYEKVEENADLRFGLALSPAHVNSINPEKTERKEKQGDKEVSVPYYYYNIEIRYPLSLSINDQLNNNRISSGFVNNSNDYVYAKSPEFKTTAERTKWYNDHYKKFVQDWKKKHLDFLLGSVKSRIENLYAFTPTRVYQPVYTASKRRVDYTDLDKAQELAIQAYKMVTPQDSFNEAFQQQINQAIVIWKEVISQLDQTDKRARINPKVASAIQKNLAVAYYWIGDMEMAYHHNNEQAQIDRSKHWSRHFERQIKDRETRLAGGKEDAEDFEEMTELEEEDDDDDDN